MPNTEIPSRTGIAAERELHNLILDECLDNIVLPYILPQGKPHAWEASLWDYKICLPNTNGRMTGEEAVKAQEHVAQMVKDAVAFYNGFGGYIVCGIDQHGKTPVVGCDNLGADGFTIEKFNEQLFYYTRSKIGCKLRTLILDEKAIALIVVPMRPSDAPVLRLAKGAPERAGRSPAFRKDDIYVRIDDACVPVHDDLQGLQFACSARMFGDPKPSRVEHNLPPQDPNLIRFVGRTNYLLELWSWLTDRHTPLKVLTALGGTGKTAIAYEFSRLLVSSPPGWLNKIVWLTAKKQTFSALQGKYIKTTRTDFDSIDGLLRSISTELGYLSEDLPEELDRSELLDLVISGLEMFPALIVVDDLDSLDLADQTDLLAITQVLAGRVFHRGSRFLFTSRLDLNAGSSQRVKVDGFGEQEFTEYARMVAAERSIKVDDGVINRMYKASLGSPVFCASIMRLVTLGSDINTAITNWRGREGEDVRRFAFEKELGDLTDSQTRTLFALSILAETTQLELKQVLNIDDARVVNDLAKLRDFHLFVSSGDPATGTKLTVPEPIRLMGGLIRARVADPARIERECARARASLPKVQDKAAVAIAGILALWKADDYEAALFSAKHHQKQNPKNPDIHCVLGQSYMKVTPSKPDEADKAFRKAFELGCGRSELVPNWLEARSLCKDWQGIVDISNQVNIGAIRGKAACLVIAAMMQLGRQRFGRADPRAIVEMKRTMEAASKVIHEGRASDALAEIRSMCREAAQFYVSLINQSRVRAGDRIDLFNAVNDCFKCHVTETWMIMLGLDALTDWARTIESRTRKDHHAAEILWIRLQDLQNIEAHIAATGNREDLLIKLIDRRRQLQLIHRTLEEDKR